MNKIKIFNNNYYYIFRGSFLKILFLSGFISFLMLAPSVYMLQVYSRVIDSNSLKTLAWLSIMVFVVYIAVGIMERLRENILLYVKSRYEEENRSQIIDCAINYTIKKKSNIISNAVEDYETVNDTINSNLTKSVYELPFSIIVLFILFYISFFIGVASLVVAVILVFFNALSYRLSEANHDNSSESVFEHNKLIRNMSQTFETSQAMGVFNVLKERFVLSYKDYLHVISFAERFSVANEVISKIIQTLFTSLLIGLCSFLFLENSLTGGSAMIIVTSILGGRMIAPLVQITSGLSRIKKIHFAQQRINRLKIDFSPAFNSIKLPEPIGFLSVDGVFYEDDKTGKKILSGIDFNLSPGDVLAVIGPSGSGKTTLAKTLVGAIPPDIGKVTLDGVEIYKWDKEHLGQHIGYLPQEICLMDGSLRENISRFDVLNEEASQAIDELIDIFNLQFFFRKNKEYLDLQVSSNCSNLSSGQKQIIGLARALYKSPKLIVLDEPNSNLDKHGELMLNSAIQKLAQRGSTIVVTTHRKNLIDVANKVLILQDGNQVAFDKKEDIIND